MSAWSTKGRHNAIIADALVIYGVIDGSDVAATYKELADENDKSLQARYGDRSKTMNGNRWPYVPGGEVTPQDVAMLARSYSYQTCEHPGWEESRAHTLISRLINAIDPNNSLQEGAWSVSSLNQADNDSWYATSEARAGTFHQVDN